MRKTRNFRIFGPDETMSNRLGKVFEVTNRDWNNEKYDTDEFLAQDGRVMDSMLSEHMCEGWLEGISSYRTSWILCKLRSIYPSRRFYVCTACKMVKGMSISFLGDSQLLHLNLILSFKCMAAGSQRIYTSGSGIP